jgi:hypothetical protein
MGSAKDVNGGKSYNYFGTIAGAVCAGPVDALIAVIVDGKELWPGGKIWYAGATITAGQIWKFNHISFVALSDHTASTANQPGNATYWTEYTFPRGSNPYDDITISGRGVMRLYWGTQGQTVDPKLQSTGNNYSEEHPDYKGVCYIEPIDFLFGQETSTAPNIEIVVRRAPVQ